VNDDLAGHGYRGPCLPLRKLCAVWFGFVVALMMHDGFNDA
jgi:hypothetical protein